MFKRFLYAAGVWMLVVGSLPFFAALFVEIGAVTELRAENIRGHIQGAVNTVLILWVMGALREPPAFHGRYEWTGNRSPPLP